MEKKNERSCIIELYKNGMKTMDIVRATSFKRTTVYDALKRFEEMGGTSDRPRSGRPCTVLTPENVNKIRCRIRRNPVLSMRKMGRELGINEKSIRRIVKRKLKLRSYKISRVHFLNDCMKLKRVQRCRRMLRLVAGGRLKRVLFTDEKIFTIEPAHNRQNHRQLLTKGSNRTAAAKIITRSHFPASVMVWGGICGTGKTPLVFIDRNVKINAARYQEGVLRDVLQPWIRNHFGRTEFTLQQDWAPAHSAKTTMALCEQLFPGFWGKDIWPSNSPDLNAMDYSVWSVLEEKIAGKRFNSVEALKTALIRAWDSITVEECATIVGNFPKRLRKCIAAKGGNFEHLL